MRQVYLDHQAATPVLPEVFEAMRPYFTDVYASASSLHQHGLRVRDAMAEAREQVAALLKAKNPEEVIFTSCGTEAVNLAIKGVAYASQARGKHIVVSATEHPSVLSSIDFLEKQGFTCTRVKVDAEGKLNPEAVRAAMTEQTILVCVHHANYDIGTIQPIAAIAEAVQERGVPLFVDANFSGGWLPIDVEAMGASLLSISPHRFYGPKGVGVLYRNRRTRLASLIHGGMQEGGRRAGTENIPAIIGAGVAAEIAKSQLQTRIEHTTRLQKKLWDGLKIPYLKLNGPIPGPNRLSTNLNLSIEFVEGEGVVLLADTRGIAFSGGTACVSHALKVSPVLREIGVEHALALGTVILSLGIHNTEEDIDYVLETLPKVVERLRSMSPTWEEVQKGQLR